MGTKNSLGLLIRQSPKGYGLRPRQEQMPHFLTGRKTEQSLPKHSRSNRKRAQASLDTTCLDAEAQCHPLSFHPCRMEQINHVLPVEAALVSGTKGSWSPDLGGSPAFLCLPLPSSAGRLLLTQRKPIGPATLDVARCGTVGVKGSTRKTGM